ncbi:MAG: ABC transporter ATP-binding protein/permease, partial [Eubacteriales bacterium]|nr:ABC transporter ATP-binding protein/permease [Eubacteriales bacterium]
KNISKKYRIGEIETIALENLSVAFRSREFVAILGASGSGKTTCLNIIGGLDRYDSGDLIIKGKHTKNFKDADWDAYRNNSIGFVFQNYNLIPHLSIVANVELGMTLSGVPYKEKHQRAIDVLTQVGLKDHLHKNPNQLSGGQMQRVAIARALANDPEILLCDEPTGALDSTTSMQILDLIKQVASDRLVIMVTHNPALAEKYADRVIHFEDGHITDDSHPHLESAKDGSFTLKKTAMNFVTALGISFNNIRTKKGRTFLTAFASSIGIIGIALILSLSAGFQIKIDEFQRDALSEFPIMITRTTAEVNYEALRERREENMDLLKGTAEYADTDAVYLYNPSDDIKTHTNKLTDEFIQYMENIDPEICGAVGYTRFADFQMLRKIDGKAVPVSSSTGINTGGSGMSGMNAVGLTSYPSPLSDESQTVLERDFDLLSGTFPESIYDVILIIDNRNRADSETLGNLGFTTTDDKGELIDSIDFADIIGTEIKIVSNDDFYKQTALGNYIPSDDYEAMYESEDGITVKIAGIARRKADVTVTMLGNGIVYSDKLTEAVIRLAAESQIVKAQREADYNVITMEPLEKPEDRDGIISYLGGNIVPFMVSVYPTSFENKEKVIEYIDGYNTGKADGDLIVYQDLAESISNLSASIMDGITIVLIAFASISLVVALIMIGIITYTSVLQRTREIGILKALGARKKDIARVFDAETFILGLFSGSLGVMTAWLLTFPANAILYKLTDLNNIAQLQPTHAVILISLNTVLTMLGGHIPAKMASNKDAVEALRSV